VKIRSVRSFGVSAVTVKFKKVSIEKNSSVIIQYQVIRFEVIPNTPIGCGSQELTDVDGSLKL
jgi:hypothetical protein